MAEPTQHQPAGISVRGVVWGGAAIVSAILLAAAASYLLWQQWSAPDGTSDSSPNAKRLPQVAPPVLQAAPQDDRARYFAEKRRLLDSWEWIDREHGVVRIPIQEAMQIMAAHGGNTAPAGKERR